MGNLNKNNISKQIQININHPSFKQAKLVTIQKQRYLFTSFGLDEKTYNFWQLSLQKYKNQPKRILLPSSKTFNRKGMCGNAGLAQIFYPNYSYQLSQQIYNRCGHKSLFKQTQIWHLLLDLIIALRQSIQVKQPIDDIRPRNLFLNEVGDVKVPTICSFPQCENKYHKKLEGQEVYFAPEELIAINNKTEHQIIPQKAAIFSIGLTLLSLGNRTQYEGLYDYNKNYFNEPKFRQELQKWKANKYSLILKSTITNLLSLNPEERMTLADLEGLLLKNQQKINNYHNFVIENPPLKLHNEAKKMQRQISSNTQTSLPILHNNLISNVSKQATLQYPAHLQVHQVTPQYVTRQQVKEKQTQKSQTDIQSPKQ